ncbi:hypothetical protein [Oceanirhabdus sp. W0125-5]|uniref:hypothetical protein n=1 Tax=Oceanirhabdus sp. W0125-5 TaxID=2999116 RepID=UPI0022F2DAB8|nr:hypothetical protein [Oceanirhabdus sp. W0125-5]WBW96231.1 hypothetical protein OW730_21440 [Oceanirhabdus sp. W0125-5]
MDFIDTFNNFIIFYTIFNICFRSINYFVVTVVLNILREFAYYINNKTKVIIKNKINKRINISKLESCIALESYFRLRIFLINIDRVIVKYFQFLSSGYFSVRENIMKSTIELVKSAFKPCLFNVLCGIYVNYFILNNNNFITSFYSSYYSVHDIISNFNVYIDQLDKKYKDFMIIIIFVPFFKSIYDFIYFRFKNQYNKEEIRNRFRTMIDNIYNNIKQSNYLTYRRIDEVVKNITFNIGFNFKDSKLNPIKERNISFDEENKVKFFKISHDIERNYKIIKDIHNQDNSINSTKITVIREYLWEELNWFYNIERVEKKVLDYQECSVTYKKCRGYFEKNENQIYKHLFTNARVINKEPLKRLEYYIKEVEDYLVKYKEDINEYIFKLLVVRVATVRFYPELMKIFYSRDLLYLAVSIIKLAFMKYFIILKTILY